MKPRLLHVHDIPTTKCRVDVKFNELGYRVESIEAECMSQLTKSRFEMIILDVPACRLKKWLNSASNLFSFPILWWCDERKPATTAPHEKLDGVLCSGMNDNELQWSLLIGLKNYQTRVHLEREYRFLSTKLEEIKRVECAKISLSKQKNISETKAYEWMRTQAMNERKKLVDIAEAVLTEIK
ncbi:ANTAR domain-containing response regulator [Paenibacillus illinoisensis]|uniref:ANTAR domain-containing response regulator n=2 Tax=Paenibacillus illinoisensis TaxID=59845 RepID=UPI00301B8554